MANFVSLDVEGRRLAVNIDQVVYVELENRTVKIVGPGNDTTNVEHSTIERAEATWKALVPTRGGEAWTAPVR